jgi:hypothetical protein
VSTGLDDQSLDQPATEETGGAKNEDARTC